MYYKYKPLFLLYFVMQSSVNSILLILIINDVIPVKASSHSARQVISIVSILSYAV